LATLPGGNVETTMTTTLVLIASGILIGAGISVICRDVLRNRRKLTFVLQRDLPAGDPARKDDVEITISRTQKGGSQAYADLMSLVSGGEPRSGKRETTGEAKSDLAAIEQQWADLQPTIIAGVTQVNTVLSAAILTLGTQGKPSWSYKNRGYGAFRRLLLGEESLGWVRIELSPDGMLSVSLKAHKDTLAAINGTVSAPAAGITATAIADLLSGCLKPAATSAAHVTSTSEVRAAIPVPSEASWTDVDGLVEAALRAANGALVETGAKLQALAPAAWDPLLRRHRMALAVEVDSAEVARMQIERLPHEIEVAVGVRDAQMIGLGRRRRIPIEGMTTHALAELIAGCAWPVIARFKDTRRELALQRAPFLPSSD
jgi:hypothetical protein